MEIENENYTKPKSGWSCSIQMLKGGEMKPTVKLWGVTPDDFEKLKDLKEKLGKFVGI